MKLLSLSLFSLVAAKTIRVDVGRSGTRFSPNSITAAKGDVLEFYFSGKHSVVRGDYSGCSPVSGADGGFFSGLQRDGGFRVEVTTTDPMFFYCSANSHCQGGMVGVVNPSSTQTLAGYTSNAKSSRQNVSPAAPYGGERI